MLDQNTDRMWFVIGAVIVGAAIIFIANGTLPTLFASVSDNFDGKADEASAVIEDIQPMGRNLIDYDIHTIVYDQQPDKETGEMKDNPAGWWYSTVGPFEVEGAGMYQFASPGGLAAPLVTYYGDGGEYLGFDVISEQPVSNMTVLLPTGTTHVQLSAGDKRILPEQKVGSID